MRPRVLLGRAGHRGRGLYPGSHMCFLAARSGLLRLAEALAFRGDLEVVSSTVRAVVTTLKSGEKCGVEPELVGKGTSGLGTEAPQFGCLVQRFPPGCPQNEGCGEEWQSARKAPCPAK